MPHFPGKSYSPLSCSDFFPGKSRFPGKSLNTGRFSKLPYLGMKLCHWPKCQKLHIYPLSTPGRSKLSLFYLYGQRFPRYGPIFKITILRYESWQGAKVPEVAQIASFYPNGLKLRLFLLYAKQFLRYGLIFKIAIFEHETW